MNSLRVAWLLLIFGASIYGTFFSANKFVAELGVPASAFTFWQYCIGGILLIIVSVITRNFPHLSIKHIFSYAITALLGAALSVTILSSIGNKVPAGVLTLTITLVPGITYIFAIFTGLDKLRIFSILGLTMGLIGILLLVLPGGSFQSDSPAIWIILSLAVPVFFAINNVFVALVKPPKATSIMRATGLVVFAAFFTLPIMILSDGIYLFWEAPGLGPWVILWTGIINMVTFYCMFEIIHRAGPVFFGQYNYVIVIAGVLWSLIFFNEQLTSWFWIAFLVMIVGLYFGNIGAKQNLENE